MDKTTKQTAPIQRNCILCGAELNKKTLWKFADKLGGGYVPFCVKCQDKFYMWLSQIIGYKLSVFFCAAFFNVPYLPQFFTEAKAYKTSKGIWGGYIQVLHDNHSIQRGFSFGLTDIKKAFEKETQDLDVDDDVLTEEEIRDRIEALHAEWGTGPAGSPYDDDDYLFLADIYHAYADTRPERSDQTDLAIRKISKWTLEQNRCFMADDISGVEKWQKVIKTEAENEQLRRKDETVEGLVHIDGIVDALNRHGIPIMDKDELGEFLANHSLHPVYHMTRDAADQALLFIINATRWNEGQAELPFLPQSYQITDSLEEFEKRPDATEKANFKKMNLPSPR